MIGESGPVLKSKHATGLKKNREPPARPWTTAENGMTFWNRSGVRPPTTAPTAAGWWATARRPPSLEVGVFDGESRQDRRG